MFSSVVFVFLSKVFQEFWSIQFCLAIYLVTMVTPCTHPSMHVDTVLAVIYMINNRSSLSTFSFSYVFKVLSLMRNQLFLIGQTWNVCKSSSLWYCTVRGVIIIHVAMFIGHLLVLIVCSCEIVLFKLFYTRFINKDVLVILMFPCIHCCNVK